MTPLDSQEKAEALTGLYQDLEARIMANIVRHCRDYEQPIASDRWQLKKLAEIGSLDREHIRLIAAHADVSQTALERMLLEAAEEALNEVEPPLASLYRRGLVGAPVKQAKSRNVRQAMEKLQEQAKDVLNLCNTTMLYKARDAYRKLVRHIVSEADETAGKAEFLDRLGKHASTVALGVESRQAVVRKCIREFNEKGIPAFVDKRGREWTPEAYVNMAIRNTAKHAADEVQTARCRDYGVHLVEIDSHSGARPKCARDQGKLFDLDNGSGFVEDAAGQKVRYYPWNSSSYGEPDGLLGINCRHHKYPFWPGMSLQSYFPVEPEENDRLYKQTQIQRALERSVRAQKRECMLYDQIGDRESFEKAAVKLKQKEAKLKSYVDGNPKLHRKRDREQVAGFDRRISAEAAGANKQAYNKFVKSVGGKNAPSFTEYSQAGYTKSKAYKELKALSQYREKVPNADLVHLRLNEALHSEKLIKGYVVPVESKRAFILEDKASRRDPAHIMERMAERKITADQVQWNVDHAEFCVSQFRKTRLVYYSKEGVTVLTKTEDYEAVDWIAKTTWSKHDFDEQTERIMEVAANVQSR